MHLSAQHHPWARRRCLMTAPPRHNLPTDRGRRWGGGPPLPGGPSLVPPPRTRWRVRSPPPTSAPARATLSPCRRATVRRRREGGRCVDTRTANGGGVASFPPRRPLPPAGDEASTLACRPIPAHRPDASCPCGGAPLTWVKGRSCKGGAAPRSPSHPHLLPLCFPQPAPPPPPAGNSPVDCQP